MKNLTGLFIFLLIALFACNKEQKTATCPVSYTVDTTNTVFTLLRKWDFIGFVDTVAGTTTSPLCTGVVPYLTFTDSTASTLSYPYNIYPLRFTGLVLLNFYDGSYKTLAGNGMELSQTDDSKVIGSSDVQQFEARYHALLVQVSNYKISHNILTLYPNDSTTVMRFVADF